MAHGQTLQLTYYTLTHEDGTKQAIKLKDGNGSLADYHWIAASLVADGVDPNTVTIEVGVQDDHPIVNDGKTFSEKLVESAVAQGMRAWQNVK